MSSSVVERISLLNKHITDEQTVRHYHDKGIERYNSAMQQAVLSGAPAALMTVAMLSSMRVASVDEVIDQRVTHISVGSNGVVYVNGAFFGHPESPLQTDKGVPASMLLHEGIHPMYLHETRMARHVKQLIAQGRVGNEGPHQLTDQQAATLWNIVADLVDDNVGLEIAQGHDMYSTDLITGHIAQLKEMMHNMIEQFDITVDAHKFIDAAARKTESVESLVERFIDAIPEPETDDEDGDGGEDGEQGGGGGAGGNADTDNDGDADSDSDGRAGDGGHSDGDSDSQDDARPEPTLGATLEQHPKHIELMNDLSDAAIESAEAEASARIIMAGKLAGKGTPFDKLVSDAEAILEDPVVTWQEKFQQSMNSVSNDLSYENQYPPSLTDESGIILPDYKPGTGKIALFLDTSSSVWDDPPLRRQLLRELSGIVATIPFESVYLIPCDTVVHACIEVQCGDEFPIEHIRGGGGTSFDPPFEHLKQERLEVDAIVYATDGYAHVTVDEPDVPMIWLLGQHSTAAHLPWGEVIEMVN